MGDEKMGYAPVPAMIEPLNPLTLFPVVSMVTGTTPNGGGIWKHVLRSEHGLLRRNHPILVQALHFLDFKGVNPATLRRWREKPLQQHYNGQFDLKFSAELFTDSGGFTLMFDPELDLSNFDIPRDWLPEGIVDLQLDFGATTITSLDYPIPPGIQLKEAKRRQELTFDSAIRSARRLMERDITGKVKLTVPIHGHSPKALSAFVDRLLTTFDREGLLPVLQGFGLGSMVPRRKLGGGNEVLEFVRAARQNMPQHMPLHVFGITGSLLPFLISEGVTSMDTSGYIQKAKTLKYVDPKTLRGLSWKHLPAYPCDCLICKNRDIQGDQATMRIEGITAGLKSEVYAAIALHNLELEYQVLRETTSALRENRLDAYLENFSVRFPDLLRPGKAKAPKPEIVSHRREDFDLRQQRHRFKPREDTVLLVLPCSQEKPYTSSSSFKRVWKHLEAKLGLDVARLEVVFLSGLYGPVPMAFVENTEIVTYDFLLHGRDAVSIAHGAKRLDDFMEKYGAQFRGVVAYVSQPAYRSVIQQAKAQKNLELLPKTGRMGRNAFYKAENLEALSQHLFGLLKADQEPLGFAQVEAVLGSEVVSKKRLAKTKQSSPKTKPKPKLKAAPKSKSKTAVVTEQTTKKKTNRTAVSV